MEFTPTAPTLPPSTHTLTSLKGLKAAGVRTGLKPSGNPDLALLVAETPMACAGVFTQNHFSAAPVRRSQKHLAATGGLVRAVVVNAGNANSCTGAQGDADALEMCTRVAKALACPVEEVLVCSTGVIGQKLQMEKVRQGIDSALNELSTDSDAGRKFLDAIMTTDAFRKEASVSRAGHLFAGVAKGAGMVQPDMATMLAFVAMDSDVAARDLRENIGRVASRSFNAVHVDSHTSTNDTFLLLSTRSAKGSGDWRAAVDSVSHRLAWLIARDGLGATKVTTIDVKGAVNDDIAKDIARRVATSALVRTALFGCDPNWGRIVSQVGNVQTVKNPRSLRCVLGGIEVFRTGEPTQFDRAQVAAAMGKEDVSIELTLADGSGSAVVLTSDLGYRYVQVNSEYTS